MENNKIIIRDLKEKEMTVYNPDGSILVITSNYLCINDILIQIKEQSLEGYSISNGTLDSEGELIKCPILKNGRIKGYVRCKFDSILDEQLSYLVDFNF